jgi:hypothetical protein
VEGINLDRHIGPGLRTFDRIGRIDEVRRQLGIREAALQLAEALPFLQGIADTNTRPTTFSAMPATVITAPP